MSTQETLPGMKPFLKSNRPRPKITDDKIVQAAAHNLAVRLNEEFDDIDPADAYRDLVKVLDHETDGYRIAKALEIRGWDPDAEMVEVLDEANMELWTAFNSAVEQWVVDAQIEPMFKEGDRVAFTLARVPCVGVIESIEEKRAQYIIKIEGRAGRPYVNFEDCAAETA